ncbi:hypothetical protein YC2023_027188 [Brassica napus]
MDEQKKCSSNAVVLSITSWIHLLSMQLKEHATKKYAQNSKPKIRLASVVPPLKKTIAEYFGWNSEVGVYILKLTVFGLQKNIYVEAPENIYGLTPRPTADTTSYHE